jgi:TonB family protein
LRKQIAFPSDTEIALGESISILNTFNAKTGSNILSNPFMASLIQSIPPNAMFWYVGNSPYLLDKSPVPIPAGIYNFKGVAGAFNFTNAVTGQVAILTNDLKTADELVELYSKIKTVGELMEGEAGLKMLARGLVARRVESQVNLALRYSVDSLEKIRNWSSAQDDSNALPGSNSEIFKLDHGNGLVFPVPIFQSKPPYTEDARKARAEGYILLRCVIREDGTPGDIETLRGLGYGLEESAIHTVKSKWRFLPALLNGKPVKVETNIQISFRLY